jgi:hypothetical protein
MNGQGNAPGGIGVAAWLLWLFQILAAGTGAVGRVMSTFHGPPF